MGEKIEVGVEAGVDEASLAAAERELDQFAERIAQKFAGFGERAGERFRQSLDERSRDTSSRDSDMFGDGLVDAAQRVGTRAAETFSAAFTERATQAVSGSIGAAVGFGQITAATGGVNLLVTALLALAAAAAAALAGLVLLTPVLATIGGLAASTATAFVGLAATAATLMLGFGGLGDAWTAYGQKAAGGGQSATAAARAAAQAQREVKAATEALADAQRDALAAQRGLEQARADEAERLEDLSRSLRGAKLSEASAVLAVREAEERLRQARHGGSALDIARAVIGVDEAKLRLEEVKDRVGDLSREQDKANRDGIEGSDRVQAAYERQRQAQRRLEDATYRLADAQARLNDGVGGGAAAVDRFAEAMDKLSPNAQKLVMKLISLQDRFDGLKKRVQDRLLAGFDTEVQRLADVWLPRLDTILGETADSVNNFGMRIADAITTPEFQANVETASRTFNRFIDKLAVAVPKLITAFGTLSAAAEPFFEVLGDKFAGMIENFADWIDEADKNGSLDKFFMDAAKAVGDLWTIGGLVLDILGEIVEILWPKSKKESDSFLGGVKDGLTEIKEWLADPENQKKIQELIDGIQGFVHQAATEWLPKAQEWADKIDRWADRAEIWAARIAYIPKRIKAAWDAAGGVFDGLKAAFRSALNWIIDKWNGLKFTIPPVTVAGVELFGGATIGTENIGRFAHGGIAGGLIMAGEHGRELIRVPQGSTVIPNGTTESMLANGGGGGILRVVIDLQGSDEELKRRIKKMVRIDGGGSVEVAFT